MGHLHEADNLSDILKFEQPNQHSREQVTIKASQDLVIGEVVGKATLAACPATGTATSPITGGGTVTGVTAGLKAKVGTYTLRCIHAVATQGIFSVADPNGAALPTAYVGQAYVNDQINFTINDGSPDFALGDTFTITIAAGTGYVEALDLDGVLGNATAYGITIAAYDASGGAIQGVIIVRNAIIVGDNLTWPSGATAAQKAAALAIFKAAGIVDQDDV